MIIVKEKYCTISTRINYNYLPISIFNYSVYKYYKSCKTVITQVAQRAPQERSRTFRRGCFGAKQVSTMNYFKRSVNTC